MFGEFAPVRVWHMSDGPLLHPIRCMQKNIGIFFEIMENLLVS